MFANTHQRSHIPDVTGEEGGEEEGLLKAVEVQGVNGTESREDGARGAWPRLTPRGQMLTALASSSANGLLIEAAT